MASPEISEEDVIKVLKNDKGPDAKLVQWLLNDFTKPGDNYVGVVSSIEVVYHYSGEELVERYVVKLNPSRNTEVAFNYTNKLFKKEAGFYDQVIPALNKPLVDLGEPKLSFPTCYHVNHEKHHEKLFMEDLRLRGFKMCDRRKSLTKDQTNLVMAELGIFHAASILLQKMTSFKRDEILQKYPCLDEPFDHFVDSDGKDRLGDIFLDAIEKSVWIAESSSEYETIVQYLKSLQPRVMEVVYDQLKCNEPFQVICHGDIWVNNLLFRSEENGTPVEVILVDLQQCRLGSPALDLGNILFTSLTQDVRQPHLSEFLSTYHASFTRVLKASHSSIPFNQEDLNKEFQRRSLYGILITMLALPLCLAEKSDVPDLDDLIGGNSEEHKEAYRNKMKELICRNPLVKSRLLGVFDDMIKMNIYKFM